MRTNLSLSFFPRLFCAVVLSFAACNPDTVMLVDTDVPPPPPDMTTVPVTPYCEVGSERCSPNHDAVEICDGKSWQIETACDLKAEEICSANVCKKPCDLVSRGNVGCSFYPVNLWSTSTDGDLGIVVTNTSSTLTAEVNLEDANGPQWCMATEWNPISGTYEPPSHKLPPGGVIRCHLPHTFNKMSRTDQVKKGMHLLATNPVAVYQFHPIDAARVWSGSATLLLPEHVMSKDYFIMSYTYNSGLLTTPPQGQGFLAVVGLSDNTTVDITVPVATEGNGAIVPALKAGGKLTRRLNRLEVLEIIQENSLDDITGATIKSSAPVAVYGGAGGVSIPVSAIGGNHLGVQMFPLDTWGKRYIGAKVKQRNASDKDYYRIVASVDNTTFTLSGPGGLPMTLPHLAKGQFFEFSTASNFIIESDKPIMAFQFMPAWGNLSGQFSPQDFPDGAPDTSPGMPCRFVYEDGGANNVKCLGDANITPLIPVEQYRKDYIFYVPETYKYQYINVLAPTGTQLSLDGTPITDAILPIASGFGRVIVRIQNPGNHRITGDQPFGLIGYGYAAFTSYSYAGGLNLEVINPQPG